MLDFALCLCCGLYSGRSLRRRSCRQLWGRKGRELLDRALHAGKHFVGVGVGLDNLCWGHAPQKVLILVQGYVEIGRVLPSMQLANQTRM